MACMIRCAWTIDGNIEGAVMTAQGIARVVIDPYLGNLVKAERVREGDDLFRHLISAARRFVW